MKKGEIAFCIRDKVYRERLVRCWMYHYKHIYHVHVFSDIQEIVQKEKKTYKVIITDFYECIEIKKMQEIAEDILVLWEKESDITEIEKQEGVICTSKYQEVYKMEEKVKMQIESSKNLIKDERYLSRKSRKVGVFSVDYESMQMPFAALIACEYGEKEETLLINLQAYSGLQFESLLEEEGIFGLEDLMTMSSKDVYSKGRLYGAIGHEQNWDYIYPPKNTELLSEGNDELYQKIIEMMAKEFDYRNIIINFGETFSGMSDLMEICDDFYMLVSKYHTMSAREKDFQKELKRKGKDVFIQQIKRIEMPYVHLKDYSDWKKVLQQWRWSEVGDMLRKYIWAG